MSVSSQPEKLIDVFFFLAMLEKHKFKTVDEAKMVLKVGV